MIKFMFDNKLNKASSITLDVTPVSAAFGTDALLLFEYGEELRVSSGNAFTLSIVLNAPEFVSGLMLHRHNLTGTATLQVIGYNDAAMTSEAFDTGSIKPAKLLTFGSQPFGAFTWGETEGKAGERIASHFWDGRVVKAVKLMFDDALNTAGYVSIHYIFLGTTVEPRYGFAPGVSLAQGRTMQIARSRLGSPFVTEGHNTKNHTLQLPNLNAQESLLFEGQVQKIGDNPIAIVGYEGELALRFNGLFFVKGDVAHAHIAPQNHTLSMSVEGL